MMKSSTLDLRLCINPSYGTGVQERGTLGGSLENSHLLGDAVEDLAWFSAK